MYGDKEGLEKAIQRAISNNEELEKIRTEQTILDNRPSKIHSGKARAIDAIADGLFSKDDVREKITAFNDATTEVTARLESIQP